MPQLQVTRWLPAVLRAARNDAGLTQRELVIGANHLKIKYDGSTFSRIETGKQKYADWDRIVYAYARLTGRPAGELWRDALFAAEWDPSSRKRATEKRFRELVDSRRAADS